MARQARFVILAYLAAATAVLVIVNSASIDLYENEGDSFDLSRSVRLRDLSRQGPDSGTNVSFPIHHEAPAPATVFGEECAPSCTTKADCASGEICTATGVCGPSCTDPSKCRSLPAAPTHGKVVVLKTGKGDMRVMFFCDDEYRLVDESEWKTCINGTWVPKDEMPRCVPIPGQILRKKRKAKYVKSGTTYDNDGDTYSDGTVLNVTCTEGEIVTQVNRVSKCINGQYKPGLAVCKARNLNVCKVPCKVPYIERGWCYEGSKMLYFEELIRYGKRITIRCGPGYKLVGVSQMACHFGWEFSVGYPPECVPAPCTLPVLQHGAYLGSFTAGQVVEHDVEVDYTCDGDFQNMRNGPSRCHFGGWKSIDPHCVHPSMDPADRSPVLVKVNASTASRRGCLQPPPEPGSLLHVEGRPIAPEVSDLRFLDGMRILYKCMGRPGNETLKRNRWIQTCSDGTWRGRPRTCNGEVDHEAIQALLDTINSTCSYGNREANLVHFSDNKEVENKTDDFPPGTVITSRCSDIGKFEFRGAVHRKCVSGQWLGATPKCEGLSQLHDYALDKNPTILFRYVNGSIRQSNSGELVIYPGTTVHMDCLWIRKFGSPRWKVKLASAVEKEYVEGWTDNIPGRYANLEYRITIPEAGADDSGYYTCKTPSRHSHTIRVVVQA